MKGTVVQLYEQYLKKSFINNDNGNNREEQY